MRVTAKGQVTIPKDLRDAYGIGAGTEVVFEAVDDVIVVRKVASGPRKVVEWSNNSGISVTSNLIAPD